jgi:hypothetical protein
MGEIEVEFWVCPVCSHENLLERPEFGGVEQADGSALPVDIQCGGCQRRFYPQESEAT